MARVMVRRCARCRKPLPARMRSDAKYCGGACKAAVRRRRRHYWEERARAVSWMQRAVELSSWCPPSPGAYSVGAVIVSADGTELAAGYSREEHPREHAEEAALRKLAADDPRLNTAVLYSTLEPCTQRSADRTPCTYRVIEAGIPHVVIAWREPPLFVSDCTGVEELSREGIHVTELPELAARARAVNSHLRLDGETE